MGGWGKSLKEAKPKVTQDVYTVIPKLPRTVVTLPKVPVRLAGEFW